MELDKLPIRSAPAQLGLLSGLWKPKRPQQIKQSSAMETFCFVLFIIVDVEMRGDELRVSFYYVCAGVPHFRLLSPPLLLPFFVREAM